MSEGNLAVDEFRVTMTIVDEESDKVGESAVESSDAMNAGLRLITVSKDLGGSTVVSFTCMASNEVDAWRAFHRWTGRRFF